MLAGGCSCLAGLAMPGPLSALPAWCAACFLALSLAYILQKPAMLMKKPDGTVSWPSYLLFWPYHLLNRGRLLLVKILGRESAVQAVSPGLFLGRRLVSHAEAYCVLQHGLSVLDTTCEFAELRTLRRACGYLCVPLLDHTAPSRQQLQTGVDWMLEQSKRGPVFVHCAAGHGRSAAFVCAFLVKAGLAASAGEAIVIVVAKRPGVRMSRQQLLALDDFCSHEPA